MHAPPEIATLSDRPPEPNGNIAISNAKLKALSLTIWTVGHSTRSLDELLHGIAYQWILALGGRRPPNPDSPNIAWRNSAFRGYADHVASEEFAAGLFDLLTIAEELRHRRGWWMEC